MPSPDSLLVVVGRTPDELSRHPGAEQVTGILSGDCDTCSLGVRGAGMTLLLSVVAAGLLFPVLIFIGTATRLSAARREQRFAAMRLVGATPRQISTVAAVESAVAAFVGTVVGFGLFLLLRPALAEIPFTGTPFFGSDLSLGPVEIALVALGVPAAAMTVAGLALRRVRISPLGVTRRATPRPPRAWRLIPLVLGIGELVYFVGRRPQTANGQSAAYLSGILLVMVGLVVAGPWLTMLGSRVMARRATRPALLIAGRRLADNPQAGFRAVSGLMLALFVTSVATGVITTIVANRGAPRDGSVFDASVSKTFWPEERVAGQPEPAVEAALGELRSIPGVREMTVVHQNPNLRQGRPEDPMMPGVISCAELARLAVFGGCPAGAQVAGVYPDLIGARRPSDGPTVWPAANVPVESLSGLPAVSVVARTDGSATAPDPGAVAAARGHGGARQPRHRRVQPGGRRGRRPHRAQAAVQHAAAGRGAAASLAIIGSTMPLLRRITGPETARNE